MLYFYIIVKLILLFFSFLYNLEHVCFVLYCRTRITRLHLIIGAPIFEKFTIWLDLFIDIKTKFLLDNRKYFESTIILDTGQKAVQYMLVVTKREWTWFATCSLVCLNYYTYTKPSLFTMKGKLLQTIHGVCGIFWPASGFHRGVILHKGTHFY